MIISRREFYKRGMMEFQMLREAEEMMSVEQLFHELQMDVPFRNHEYMFDEKIDISKLPLQEETVGIKNKFPKIKTEGERYEKIREELLAGTYASVPVKRDIDSPCVIHIDDGLHRVYIAHSLGMKFIRVRAMYGKFILSKTICFGDLVELFLMLEKLFGKKHKTFESARKFLQSVIKKKPDIAETHSLTYGNDERLVEKKVKKHAR